jgi:hypothetical protein
MTVLEVYVFLIIIQMGHDIMGTQKVTGWLQSNTIQWNKTGFNTYWNF